MTIKKRVVKKKAPPKDKVIFRMFNGEVIALFPEQKESRGNVNSYMHIGQHGGANYDLVMSKSKKATPSQYKDLKTELKSIGYKLDVKEKYIRPRRK
jgi:hypothetical protein